MTIFSCSFLYCKNIELNGLKIGLSTNVSKETVNIGKSVNEEKQDDKEEKKNTEDKYVKVELIVENDNPYETANVTIEEIAPTGFRQLESRKNEKIINIKLDAKAEKKIEYTYRYHQSFLKDQNSSIIYDEDRNLIDNTNNISFNNEKNSSSSIENRQNNKSKTPEEDLKRGVTHILIFLLMFIGCVILLYVFRMLYKTIKGNDDSFFGGIKFN